MIQMQMDEPILLEMWHIYYDVDGNNVSQNGFYAFTLESTEHLLLKLE